MFDFLLFAFVLIVIICLIYWVFYKNSDRSKRADAEHYLTESAGVFDDAARHALGRLTQIRDPQAVENFKQDLAPNIDQGQSR